MDIQQVVYKLVLVGEHGAGKTTYVKRVRTAEFEPKLVATLGVEVHPIRLELQDAEGMVEVTFNCWDTAGKAEFGGLREGYYIEGDACLAFHDLTAPTTRLAAEAWAAQVQATTGEVPTRLVGNKRDLVQQPPQAQYGEIHISCKTNQELYTPLLELARELLERPELVHLEPTEEAPQEINYPADLEAWW